MDGQTRAKSKKVAGAAMKTLNKTRLGRICHRCDERYIPTGKHQRICAECFRRRMDNRKAKYCKFCGVRCVETYKIELRKEIYSSFCKHCFSLLYNKDTKEIKKLIKTKDLNSI